MLIRNRKLSACRRKDSFSKAHVKLIQIFEQLNVIQKSQVTSISPGEINRTEHKLWQVRKREIVRKSVVRVLHPSQGRTAKRLLSSYSTKLQSYCLYQVQGLIPVRFPCLLLLPSF